MFFISCSKNMTTLEKVAIYVKDDKLANKVPDLDIMAIAHIVLIESFIGDPQWEI